MSLIDDLTVSCAGSAASVTLTPVGLAQFRDPSYPPVEREKYTLVWVKDGIEVGFFDNDNRKSHRQTSHSSEFIWGIYAYI